MTEQDVTAQEDVLATTAYNVRGHTWHTRQGCKRGAGNEVALEQVTSHAR